MKLKTIDYRTWFLWVIVPVVSIILTYLLYLILILVLYAALRWDQGGDLAGWLTFFSFGIILGALQLLVIRRVISLNVRWIAATELGVILSFIPYLWLFAITFKISATSPPPLRLPLAAIAGAMMGLFIGSAQWLILRKIVRSSKLWIFLNFFGYSLGFTGWYWKGSARFSFFDWLGPNLADRTQGLLFASVALIVPAAITGFFIVRMSPITHPPKE